MATISITDQLSLSGSVKVSDDSPLSLAKLSELRFKNLPVISDLQKPLDQFPLDEVDTGVTLSAPKQLVGSAALNVSGGTSGSISVLNHKSETLFDDDGFAPRIEIPAGDCWAGLTIGLNVKESAGATAPSGFGVTLTATQEVDLGTYVHFPTSSGAGIPTVQDGLAAVITSYSVPATAQEIRAIPRGTAHTAEMDGTISFGASYSAPLTLNPLATLNLPLNLALNVAPDADASVSGTVELSGTFVVRAYRSAPDKLVFGVYKKKGVTLSATLATSIGVGVNYKTTDLISKVLNALIPAPDLSGLHLDDAQQDELAKALKDCVDQSISIALNACCTASDADESAVAYELDLSGSDMQATDAAIGAALKGDWSQLETLKNAKPLRNIVRELKNRKHKLTLNLLGLYNATSIQGYLTSSTVMHDEHGQIVMIDKASAKGLAAGTTPYTAKADKLRSALAHAFVATATYGAGKGKLGASFAVRQSLLEYHAKATAADLTPEVLLARAVGLALNPQWDLILQSKSNFNQSKFYLDVSYDSADVLQLFYRDVDKRLGWTSAELDRIGRNAKMALLPPGGTNSLQRRTALSSDPIWGAMKECGNVMNFRQLPGLARMDATAVAAIGVDYLEVRWWSDALSSVTPKLTKVLAAIDSAKATNPLDDPALMAAHKDLENALSGLAKQDDSSFNDGWPLAVMYCLATASRGANPSVQMDVGWNGKFEHYTSGEPLAASHSSGN